jgi:Zn-dependent protease/CBS domain-containing protein
MKWSWKLGRFAGIDVYLHATFILFVAWIAAMHWMSGQGLDGMLTGTGFIIALFGSVLLHEFGHSLTARRYGISTRNITLLPIGGVSQLERMPTEPWQELVVTLAGPAVNVVIAVGLFALLTATGELQPLNSLALTSGSLLERVMFANVSLMFFNLLPAFPMDGGRALRAFLSFWMSHNRATQVAATVGQGFAVIFGFVGLLVNPLLVLIAIFVWFGASQEAAATLLRSALSGIPVSKAMLTDFHTLQEQDSLSRAVDLMQKGSQHDFPVMVEGRLTGLLTRTDLVTALSEHGDAYRVADAMRRDFHTVDSAEALEGVFPRLAQPQDNVIPVTHAGQVVGLLTAEKVAEYLMLHNAIEQSDHRKDVKAA